MRLDIKGALMVSIGVTVMIAGSYFSAGQNMFIAMLYGWVAFMCWLAIMSGVSSLWEVRKDKKLRAARTDARAQAFARPSIPHPTQVPPGVPPPVITVKGGVPHERKP